MKMPAAVIREEILKSGAISFARFMEIALYCPETGYYETKNDIIGQRGDFITSVSTGPLFGELLAFQFAVWLKEIHIAERLSLVETGAHGGQLAADILSWLRANRAELFEKIKYVIVEPSSTRRAWQEETLKPFAGKVQWVIQLAGLANWQSAIGNRQLLQCIIFSNELLDAFPVHRFGWDAAKKEWFEWGVALDGENFCWSKIQLPVCSAGFSLSGGASEIGNRQSAIGNHFPSSLLDVLPDNYTIETSPAAEQWWGEAAALLSCGKLLAIDYGYSAQEMFSPARTRGTLRGYYKHHVTDDLLANPGEQDLTAHVNFDAIQKTGEAAGLRTEQFCTQPQFLTRILQRAVTEKYFAQLNTKQVRQFQTLTHPEHLGRAFRVLVQGR